MKNTRKLVFMALFIALEIVLTRFVALMPSNITRISLSFVVYAFAGSMFGPLFGAMSAGVGDLVGAILFPPPGGFVIGFTISAIVNGLIYGFLKLKKGEFKRLVVVLVVSILLVDFTMNTYWLHLLTQMPIKALLAQRIPGILVNSILRFTVLITLMQKMNHGGFYEDRHSNSTGSKTGINH